MKNETTMIIRAEDPAGIEKLTGGFIVRSVNLHVTDLKILEQVNEIILLGKNLIKAIQIVYDPLIAKVREPWEKRCAEKRNLLARIEPEIKRLDREAAIFLYEENKKRQAAEEEARRLAEEKKCLEEQAIREAQEREARARREAEDAARRAREAEARAKAAVDEQARRIAQAEADKIRQQAQEKEAAAKAEVEAILDKAAVKESAIVEAAPVVEEKIKLDGQTQRDHWIAEVTDADLVPREYCSPDSKKLAEAARLFKNIATIPGVRIYNQPLMVKR